MIVLFKLLVVFVCFGILLYCANALFQGVIGFKRASCSVRQTTPFALLITSICGVALILLAITVAPGYLSSTFSAGRITLSGGEAGVFRVVVMFALLYVLCLFFALNTMNARARA